MKILITGAAGMLGRAAVTGLGSRHAVTGVDLPDGDLTRPQVALDLVARLGPDWIVNCAAWTAVDEAERDQAAALAANARLTANLTLACERHGCGLTHLSTDYVFSGQGEGFDESSPRAPLNHYGLTKALAEEAVEGMTAPWQIVRTSWLFGDGPVNFVKTIRRLLAEKPRLTVVDDQRGCPTYTEDLCAVLEFLVSGRHHGIFHATNQGSCTWFAFAREIACRLGQDPQRVQPCPTSAYPTPAARPACSVLRSSRLEQAGCPPRPAWQDAVGRYLQVLASGRAAFP